MLKIRPQSGNLHLLPLRKVFSFLSITTPASKICQPEELQIWLNLRPKNHPSTCTCNYTMLTDFFKRFFLDGIFLLFRYSILNMIGPDYWFLQTLLTHSLHHCARPSLLPRFLPNRGSRFHWLHLVHSFSLAPLLTR